MVEGNEVPNNVSSRRNALKAGVAMGVGAAAFAGPQIGLLGSTPAYAAACSQPFVTFGTGPCQSTSCPEACDTAGGKSVSYKADSVSGNGASASTSGGCGGTAMVNITAPSTTGQCRVQVLVWDKNCGTPPASIIASPSSAPVAGGTTGMVALPIVICASVGISSIFYQLVIRCSGDTDTTCT